jgi:hypothetical protein
VRQSRIPGLRSRLPSFDHLANREGVNGAGGRSLCLGRSQVGEELHGVLDGISHEVLTGTLRRAARDGLVTPHLDVGRVETATRCQLTDLAPGKAVRPSETPIGRVHFSLVGEEPLQFFRDDLRFAVVRGAQVVEPLQRLSPDAGQLAFERIEGCLEERWALAATQQQDVRLE